MLSRNVAQEAQGTGRRLRPRMKAVADPRLGENVVRVRRIKLNFLAELADEAYLPCPFWRKANNFRELFAFLLYYVATIK